jgi:hypothetical protein
LYPWLLKFAKLKTNFGKQSSVLSIKNSGKERKLMSNEIGEDLELYSITASLAGWGIIGMWPHLKLRAAFPWQAMATGGGVALYSSMLLSPAPLIPPELPCIST